MSTRLHLIIGIVLLAAVSIYFWFDPQTDIYVSDLFVEHGQFVWLHTAWVFKVRHLLNDLVWLTVLLSVIGFALTFVWKKRPAWLNKRVCLFIFLTFGLAPGLIVNVTLKNQWGRPRPIQTIPFGGHDHYQKVWVKSNVCPTNCSFVCGDCSAAFAFFCFVPLLRRRRKTQAVVFTGVALFSLLLGVIRLAQGGHFISDVLSAYLIDYIVIMALFGLLVRQTKSAQNLSKEV